MNSKTSTALLVAFFVGMAIILGPWVTIWALNTLFPLLAIPFNFATWFAVIWIGAFFTTSFKVN